MSATSPPVCSPSGCYILGQFLPFVVADSPLRGTLLATAGNGQSAAPGQTFGTLLTARLTDSSGALAPSTEVVFTITEGPAAFGTSTTATVRTDAEGLATAPALVAGATTGPVLVTASQPGSTPAVFMLNVAQPGPARADLAVSLAAPSAAAAGSTFTATLTVRNRGPAPATRTVAALVVGRGLSVAGTGGGTARGPVVSWSLGDVAAGATSTRSVRLSVGAGTGSRTGRAALLVAGAVSETRDPRPLSNVAVRSVRLG